MANLQNCSQKFFAILKLMNYHKNLYFYKKESMHLKENDLVALISPAGYLSEVSVVGQAQKLLDKWGLQSYVGTFALQQNGHFAGTDSERLMDLQSAMDHPDVKMIWALRGGYGSIRIVDQLDFTKFKQAPKLLMGFSDITILHQKILQEGFESLHGFMPIQLKSKISREVIKQTKNALFGRAINYQFKTGPLTSDFSSVQAVVLGGNLANLYSLLGTDLDLDTRDKILFIEDVGEQLYQIDRMMIALNKAGKLAGLKALLVGQFTSIPTNTPSFGQSYEEIVLEQTKSYNFPVIFDAPIGHITNNYPLMLGRKVRLQKEHNIINLFQPAN